MIRRRTPLRSKITAAFNSLNRFIPNRGSRTVLKTKVAELELVWIQCEVLDQAMQNLISETESPEALEKEADSPLDYAGKVAAVRDNTEKYLEEMIGDEPSVIGSVAGSLINPEEDQERARAAEEDAGDIETGTNLDHSTQTRASENVRFQRAPFQSTMASERTTTPPKFGDWLHETTVSPRSEKPRRKIPELKL